ncbi:MAG: hypothetical protein ACP5N7_02730 [Candidatus Pacearchaeota archaeon]
MRAKLVRPSFIKEIDEDGTHWTTHWDPRKINKLKENSHVRQEEEINH